MIGGIDSSVSKENIKTLMDLIYKALFLSVSTFETPHSAPDGLTPHAFLSSRNRFAHSIQTILERGF